SRFADFLTCPDPDLHPGDFIAFCYTLASTLKNRGFVCIFFPTNDKWLEPLAKSIACLSEVAVLPFPKWEVIKTLLDKAAFAEKVKSIGVPVPQTLSVRGCDLTEN